MDQESLQPADPVQSFKAFLSSGPVVSSFLVRRFWRPLAAWHMGSITSLINPVDMAESKARVFSTDSSSALRP
jgi:hypothetical protein